MRFIKFLLDENVPDVYRKALARRFPEVVIRRVGEPSAPTRATLDPEILIWCEDNDFVLVTNNRDSMPPHLKNHLEAGRHIPGILTLNDDMSVNDTIETLALIWGAGKIEEFEDRIRYMPIRD